MRSSVRALLLALLVVGAPAGWADSVIKVNIHTDAIPAMGVPESDDLNTLWLGQNKLRDDREGQSVIVNRDDKKLYIVRHADKVYHQLDLPLDMKSLMSPDMAAQVEMMAAQMEMKVTITPTEQVETIAGHQAKLYKIDLSNAMGMSMELQMWMAEEVPLDTANFRDLYQELLSAQPVGADWIKEIMAIEGYPVRKVTLVKMMGSEFSVNEELVSIEEQEAPAGTYSPPAGYKLEPFDFSVMTGGMGGP
jgi:hypothetical protein